jgi:transcriptional regulator with XRE-family HTH domain
MTKTTIAKKKFAPATWRESRRGHTLRLQMADAERGERIRALKKLRRRKQQQVADAVGVTLRAYQEWEAGGGLKDENLDALAQFFEVSRSYITDGAEADTPDLMATLGNSENGSKGVLTRLTAIEETLARIEETLSDLVADRAADSLGEEDDEAPPQEEIDT